MTIQHNGSDNPLHTRSPPHNDDNTITTTYNPQSILSCLFTTTATSVVVNDDDAPTMTKFVKINQFVGPNAVWNTVVSLLSNLKRSLHHMDNESPTVQK